MDSIDKFSNHHFFRRGSHQPMRERFHAGRGGMSRQTNFEAGIGGTRRGDCHAGRTRPAEGPKDSALLVFRRHVAQSLSVSFKAAPASEAYSDEAASPGQSAGEVLGAANQIVQGSGESRESTIVRIRQHVHEAAEVAHTSAGDADDAGDVDKAVSLIDGGLESMARGAGASEGIESSELALYASSRRRSTISIRTQEGDFVRLQVSNKTQMGAYDSYESTDEGSSTQTEIALSSRSKVRISVQGDLNEGELAAIREVFTQAEAVAEEFFGGDLQAAFDLSSGLSFDASQLARIRLRFSAVERSAAAYEQIGSGITGSVPDSVPAATAGGPGPNPAVANTEGSGHCHHPRNRSG